MTLVRQFSHGEGAADYFCPCGSSVTSLSLFRNSLAISIYIKKTSFELLFRKINFQLPREKISRLPQLYVNLLIYLLVEAGNETVCVELSYGKLVGLLGKGWILYPI